MNDPFRYTPSEVMQHIAKSLIDKIDNTEVLRNSFREGKMLGILIVEDCDHPFVHKFEGTSYLVAFSGHTEASSQFKSFVPAIFDILNPDGYFKKEEAKISEINKEIDKKEKQESYKLLTASSTNLKEKKVVEIFRLKEQQKVAKQKRQDIRNGNPSEEVLSRLIKESQHEKAEIKRVSQKYDKELEAINAEIKKHISEIKVLQAERKQRSDALQRWLFEQYIVKNGLGEESTILEIFSNLKIMPPGGTGDCAGPKLLNFAFLEGLKPLELGEFWYGKSSVSEIRTHGCFYPSCSGKCGPLLGYMLQGLRIETENILEEEPEIIYEDEEIIVVSKPSGMPSIPGKIEKLSVLEYLNRKCDTFSVHRLDMDTSGVMVYAKNPQAQANLSKQFEDKVVKKSYLAKLIGPITGKKSGVITLPISTDYENRPRQRVDLVGGKEATTEYEVVATGWDEVHVIFRPLTGRTHQLRVHAAMGLGAPIAGDSLYGGGAVGGRLCLHAQSIGFKHPKTGEWLEFNCDKYEY